MKTALLAVAILPLLLAGCGERPRPIDPLVIPTASDLESISVTRWKPNEEWDGEFKIGDAARMEAILDELRQSNTGYVTVMDDHSPQEYSVALLGPDTMKANIWIGPDWFGGVDETKKDEKGTLVSHYRRLDPEQHARLVELLAPPATE